MKWLSEEQKILELKSNLIKMDILRGIQLAQLKGEDTNPEFLDILKNAPLIREAEFEEVKESSS